jgi:uncharacterized protein YbjT (DUF2867 family)
MKVMLFGATGMVGQGALRECLAATDVSEVLVVGRTPCGVTHPRLSELLQPDMADLSAIADRLAGYDACFFCLGVSSAGMSEAEYTRLTHDLTLSVARALLPRNPAMTFVYLSGKGCDSTERGPVMWARVRGRTENALLALGFKACFSLRPNIIQPLDGIVSKTPIYRRTYQWLAPVLPLLRLAFPDRVLTTALMGRAMLALARRGGPRPLLEVADIRAIADAPAAPAA